MASIEKLPFNMDKFGRLPSLGTERWDAPRAGKSTDNMALPVSGDDTSTRVSKTQLDLQVGANNEQTRNRVDRSEIKCFKQIAWIASLRKGRVLGRGEIKCLCLGVGPCFPCICLEVTKASISTQEICMQCNPQYSLSYSINLDVRLTFIRHDKDSQGII